jgi:hypothetical protein
VYDKNAAVTPATIDPAVQDVYANGTAEPEAIACIGTFAVHASSPLASSLSFFLNISSSYPLMDPRACSKS